MAGKQKRVVGNAKEDWWKSSEQIGDFDERLKKVKAQGESAERQGKAIPRELRQMGELDWRDDNWDSAKLRDTKTRQGQNYWRNFAKADPWSALENRREYIEEHKKRTKK